LDKIKRIAIIGITKYNLFFIVIQTGFIKLLYNTKI
jgi:hypothetical protein